MGSKDKFFSITTATHGFDDVGLTQPSGTITGVADAGTVKPRWAGKLVLTIGAITAGTLRKGQAIRTAALDAAYNQLTRILEVVSTTKIIVNINLGAAPSDVTGTWAVDGGASAWDAMMPIGNDVTAANLTITFWDANQQGSKENAVNYTKDKIYVFPGIIKTIQIATAGDVRLYRSGTLRPFGLPAQ